MNMQKIQISAVTMPRNADLAGVTGYIVNILMHQDTGLPVYMVRVPSGRIAPVSEDFEEFIVLGRCGNCDNEVDVTTLTDDYYEECLECVQWFQERMNTVSLKKKTVTADLAKVAMSNIKKGKANYGK